MNDEKSESPSSRDAEIEQEIRQGRRFNEKDVLARMAGPGALKGASPVSPLTQAETEIGNWLGTNLSDPAGALRVVVQRSLRGSELLLSDLERPLVALAAYFRQILASAPLMKELVSQADIEWGRSMDERPYFEKDGHAPHPDDPYTSVSVRKALDLALKQLD